MYAILVDVTKCTGCERCVSACLDVNHLDHQLADIDRITSRDGLSANRMLAVDKVDDGRFARKSCMHCVDPSCVSACLVGGLSKTDAGPVIYDSTKCIGCRYCMLACPFHIPRYEWDKTLPLVRKCDMCIDRLQQGQQPACVEACPNNALLFGERDIILKEAHNRIGSNPDRYLDHVWGEKEYGGTCVLYVSDVDLSKLGWSEQALAGIPSLTNPLIAKTPFIGVSVAATLLSVNWIVRRRMRLASEQSNQPDDCERQEDI
ncbi:MAG: 4Fe-4S dicluster domain-containing protein [candidate division Zixibacteria bacterium]|nr:4Fe-4S dicluster domain-containing protein [candidate division Zixibacteria bacterium]